MSAWARQISWFYDWVWRFFNELLITRNLLREFLSIYSVCIWMFNCLQYLTTVLAYSFFNSLVMLKSKRIEDRVCSLVMWFFFLRSMIWEMDGIPSIIFLFCNMLLLTRYGSSYPLCTDLSECFLCLIYSSFFFFSFWFTSEFQWFCFDSDYFYSILWFGPFPSAESGSPFIPKSPLAFCQYSGSVCCNSTEDVELQKQFKSLNVSGYGCASLLKSTLCSVSLSTW